MGRVLFVSAGPGAADLITLRGARALAQAEVVLFDALTDPALRELAPQARWLDVGKRGFCHSTKQTAINAALVREAGGTVVATAEIYDRMEAMIDVGVPNFALAEYKAPENFPAGACPLCASGVPVTRF